MLNIYKASAGSGKTYKLAYEYIRALLGVKTEGSNAYRLNSPKYVQAQRVASNRHRYILAITFTNKATEEMKRRIIDELDSLSTMPSGGNDANYAADLCREFGCTRLELVDVAAKALRELLNDYDSFSVATIDSFFQRVLRTFARELDRQGDFNVELNSTLAVQCAVDAMLDDFNADSGMLPDLGKWIYDYLSRMLEDGKKTNFFNRSSQLHGDLVKLVANICDEQFKPYYTQMRQVLSDPRRLDSLKGSLQSSRKALLAEIKAASEAFMRRLDDEGVSPEGWDSRSAVRSRILKYFLTLEPMPKSDVTGKSLTNAVSNCCSKGVFKKAAKVSDDTLASLTALLQTSLANTANYYIITDIIGSLDQLNLLAHAWGYLDDFVAANNLVLLSDTNHLLSMIIGDDDAPFIYERMGSQFSNFLIDEFQDTSKMQWRNLKPLVANGLGGGYDSLIIGDEKQSIYRFRNSDSSLLHTQVAEVDFPSPRYDVAVLGSGAGENTNYRSSADVVRFNNSFFRILASNLGIEGFENVVQAIPDRHLGLSGYVRFLPTVKEDGADSDQVAADTIDKMAQDMMRQHFEGGYRWSDIAVLVARNDQGARVIDHIVNHYPDIPVISDEALFVRRSPAVQQIISTLKILANEQVGDAGADPSKRRYPTAAEVSVAISRFGFYRDKGVADDRAIDYAMDPSTAPEGLGIANIFETLKSCKPSSLISLVETIISHVLSPTERTSQMAYLNAFQDYVLDYCSHFNPSVRAFLAHWESAKSKLSVSSASDIDAVHIMTIHKSKGLEFDCVHIPFGSWPLRAHPDQQWMQFPQVPDIDPDSCPPAVLLKMDKVYSTSGSYFSELYRTDEYARLVDTINLTYVAYTRAARELTVYFDPSVGIGRELCTAFTSDHGYDCQDGCLCSLSACYNVDESSLTLGAPTQRVVKASKASPDKVDVNVYRTYFHDGAKVLTQVVDMLDLEPDITDSDEDEADTAYYIDDEARRRGVMLHDMLSLIRTGDDIDDAVDRVVCSCRLDCECRDFARSFLSEMIDESHPVIGRWFAAGPKVLNEQSIYLPEGDRHRRSHGADDDPDEYRRPDRIVIYDDGSVDVIDYKFTAEEHGSHRRQIKDYVEILREMGYERVSGYLWYPFKNKIDKCY